MPDSAASQPSDRAFQAVNAVVSSAALGVLFWLLVVRTPPPGSGGLSFLPAVNAGFNATAAALLTAGWIAIRRGARRLHQRLMVAAFVASSLFLVGYLAYHFVHGDTKFRGTGAIRTAYLVLLASHVLLSMAVVPMALSAFWFAWRKSFRAHTRVTRVLLPIWLYVSVTGVLVYFLLHVWFA